jgi:ABC-type branched-subunit amino acid transport system substrate-binding protein
VHRRDLLKFLQSGLVATAASVVIPSSAFAAPQDKPGKKAKADKRPIALLVPLTGDRARLGLSMQQAALLAENSAYVQVFDTGGTATGAAAAATLALKAAPALILGPLLAEEVPAVTSTVAGRVPIIAFSNDSVLKAPGTYIFGITAAQVTSAILRYARGRGVRTVLVVDDGTSWSAAALLAAGRLEGELGIKISSFRVDQLYDMFASKDGPDAMLLPSNAPSVIGFVKQMKTEGTQLLGTLQGLDHSADALEMLEGAWLATPDPVSFGTFASEFAARNGTKPGAIAGLAYDAAGIANKLRADNKLNTEGLLGADGFHGVTGPVRFRTDGSVARDFAIVVARPGGYEPVAVSSGS